MNNAILLIFMSWAGCWSGISYGSRDGNDTGTSQETRGASGAATTGDSLRIYVDCVKSCVNIPAGFNGIDICVESEKIRPRNGDFWVRTGVALSVNCD